MADARTWLITGVSSGLGRALAEAVAANGDTVVGTVRTETDRIAFEAAGGPRAIGRLLDLTRPESAGALVEEIESRVGPIDVLVNNAGYGHEGVFEDVSFADLRRQFDVNVFGPIALIQAALPHMRRRRSGRIVNVGSTLGVVTRPGIIPYSMSKFAIEGLSEGLAQEVRPFGVFVTTVKPGAFRTDWNGRSLHSTPLAHAVYEAFVGPQIAARAARDGAQPGDPRKFAAAVIAWADMDDPPVHFVLGADSLGAIRSKLEAMREEIDRFSDVALSTDFD